jgi:hypothetical protein
VASAAALVRTVLSASGGTPAVMSRLVSWSSDSAGVMYRAGSPSDGTAGYHSETISSRTPASATQGSGRAVSLSHTDVVPAGYGPVGSGRHSAGPCPAGTSAADAPMPSIITGRPHIPQMARSVTFRCGA